MIPLGIYRTEYVSFVGLDTSKNNESNSKAHNGQIDEENDDSDGGEGGPSKSGAKDEEIDFEHTIRNSGKKRQSKIPGGG